MLNLSDRCRWPRHVMLNICADIRQGNNMRIAIVIAVLLIASGAQAQQQMQMPMTPSQAAFQVDDLVNKLAASVEVLQSQLKQSQDRVKELEDKYEKKTKPPK